MADKRNPSCKALSDREVRHAWEAFEREDREPLLAILKRDLGKLNSSDLEEVILRLATSASIKGKRKPGRPKGPVHNADQRAQIVKWISWLLKIKPMLRKPKRMTKDHAYDLVANMPNVHVGERTIKQIWLDAKPK